MNDTILKLADVIDSLHATPEYLSVGVPMVRVVDVNNNFLQLDNCFLVDEETCDRHNKNHIPQKGDVIITRVGSYGMLAYVDFDNRFCLGQNIAIISPYKAEDGKFLYYYLKSPYIQNIIYGNSGGSSYKCIGLEIIKKLPLMIDGIEYRKIGDLLYQIDSKIENNRKINEELDRMARTIYDYWFLQFDFPNGNGKPYKSSGGKMVWNEELKREIPEGWRIGNLSEIALITMGSSPKGESLNEDRDGIIFYQGKTDFGYRFPIVRMYTKSPIRYAEVNDILLSVRAPVGDMNIAGEKCCIGRGLAALHSRYQSFLFYLMLSNQYQFDKYNNKGTTFGAITKDELLGMRVVIPNEAIIKTFDNRISDLDKRIFSNELQNQELISLREFLLPLLMNGQVGFKEC